MALNLAPQVVGGTFKGPQDILLQNLNYEVVEAMDSGSMAIFRTEVGTCEIMKPEEGRRRALVITEVKADDALYQEAEYKPDNSFYSSFGLVNGVLGAEPVFVSGLGTVEFPFQLSSAAQNLSLEELARVLPKGFQAEHYRRYGIWVLVDNTNVNHWDGCTLE